VHTRLLLVVAVVAAAIIAVPAVRWWLAGPDLTGTGDADLAFACPEPDAPASHADADSIPTGANAVLLCRGPGNHFQEPADALETNVDDLVELVNTQPDQERPDGCTDEMGIGYRLVFGYPDGTAMDLTGQMYGCDHFQVGDTNKQNPHLLWDFVISGLQDQRSSSTPPGAPGLPECGDRTRSTSVIGRSSEMTRAVMCPFFFRQRDVGRDGSAMFSDADLAGLLADQADTERTGDQFPDADCAQDRREFDIVGVTAWGDAVSLDGICGFLHDEDGYWAPGAQAQAVIDRLYDEADLG